MPAANEDTAGVVAARAAHSQGVGEWLSERPGRHGQAPTPSLRKTLVEVGTPVCYRWALWQRTLGVFAMPTLAAQTKGVRTLLDTELAGQAELEADCHVAMLTALGDGASLLPDGAIILLP